MPGIKRKQKGRYSKSEPGSIPIQLVKTFPNMEEVDPTSLIITVDNHLDDATLQSHGKEIIIQYRTLDRREYVMIRRYY